MLGQYTTSCNLSKTTFRIKIQQYAIRETWLSNDENDLRYKEIPPPGYKIMDSHHQPWFNDRIKNKIVLRWKQERIWLKDQSEYSLNAFYIQHRHVANIIKTAQHQYYKEIIHENHNDYKAFYNIANSLLFRKSESPMPDIKPLSLLMEGFNEFFYIKIAKIMDKFKLNVPTHNPNKFIEDEYQTEMKIGILMPVSYMDVINMVKSVPPKSCKLDPHTHKNTKKSC